MKQMLKKIRGLFMKQNAQTKSARGEACSMRLDNCQGKSPNVVFAHKNGAGMGLKSKDDRGNEIGFYACGYCHSSYDTGHPYYTKAFMEDLVDQFAIPETREKLKKKLLWKE